MYGMICSAAAVNELRQHLKAAAYLPYMPDTSGPRVQYHVLLDAFDAILKELFGDDDPLTFAALYQLRYGLHDLDNGKVDPTLAPAKTDGRPKNSVAERGWRALAAAAMELYMQNGMSRVDAARKVASFLSRSGLKTSEGKLITAVRVTTWRDQVTAEQLSASPFKRRFAWACEVAPAVHGDDLGTAADHILRHIVQIYAPREIPNKAPSSLE